jgi:hypothetical protein
MIQVRARESREGAHRILEYLSLFGFKDALLEEEPERYRSRDGKPLFTVFVGRYDDKSAANRECKRLKEETRARPYRQREDLFQESLVITRTR